MSVVYPSDVILSAETTRLLALCKTLADLAFGKRNEIIPDIEEPQFTAVHTKKGTKKRKAFQLTVSENPEPEEQKVAKKRHVIAAGAAVISEERQPMPGSETP